MQSVKFVNEVYAQLFNNRQGLSCRRLDNHRGPVLHGGCFMHSSLFTILQLNDFSATWLPLPSSQSSDMAQYEKALDLWHINGVQKATARLIEGLELTHSGDSFTLHFLSNIPYFKVTEKYHIGGATRIKRRCVVC